MPGTLRGFVRRLADHPVLLLLRDYPIFLVGARTDAAVERVRATDGSRQAFERLYEGSDDPWASAAPRFRYQRRKYQQIMELIPERAYRSALDLGCGLGLLTQELAVRSEAVLGIDVAAAAIGHARQRAAGTINASFAQGDILDLPSSLDGRFDLVVLADTLYYLSPLDDELLATLAARISGLLVPGGVCVLANHFFWGADKESRLSRRIHDAFAHSSGLDVLSQHRRAFFIVTLFAKPDADRQPADPGRDRLPSPVLAA